jgi:hypothetical protein
VACADHVNLVEENTDTKRKNTESVLDPGNSDVDQEMNPEKTENMLMSQYQKAGQMHSIKNREQFL